MSSNDTPLTLLAMPTTDQLDALELIGFGAIDAKVRFIATHAPDLLDEVLDWRVDYVDRDATAPAAAGGHGARLDALIARIALGAPHAA